MTAKKKHLIELMIEVGVKWPEGAEYAAQDKDDKRVHFYKNGKPSIYSGDGQWMADSCTHMWGSFVVIPSLCRNWNQTIVTREQYEKAISDAGCGQVGEMPSKDAEHPATKSIEQLASEYQYKAEEAQRLQVVADEALKLADDALIALEKAGEAIGLIISIDTRK